MEKQEIDLLDRYFRAANYLAVGQIYLLDNPLLRKPLELSHIKPRLLGHWGTSPGLNFIYTHINRLIRKYDKTMLFITGPGHGAPAIVAQTYLEGTYSEYYPHISEDEEGLQKLFKQFSFPGGIPSHTAPETPGSIHEGGELGYSLAHAYGAIFDNKDLITIAVVGDGEAETGPLAASWASHRFINRERDGLVIPILHLNGYKIANPTYLGRMCDEELELLFRGHGYRPFFVCGNDPQEMHAKMAKTLDLVMATLEEKAPPLVILRTPKGWTGPHEIDGKLVEGTWRSHQVPLAGFDNPEHVKQLDIWLRSYKPEELFDERGALRKELRALAPCGPKRLGQAVYSNGGLLLKELLMPDYKNYQIPVVSGKTRAESATVLGDFIRDVMKGNMQNFRLFSPDEARSNKLGAVLEVTDDMFSGPFVASDEKISASGRVMEVLSEHLCQGWLEGYLLTGRHGFFACYEAFVHIVDSMFNQHAKWIKVSKQVGWRKPIASLNYFLTSHVWRQDHNGFSHQDPGFIDHVANKKTDIIRIYLPPDANCLLSVVDHCLRSKNYINVIISGKNMALQYLTPAQADLHCAKGLSIWDFASNGDNPDVIMACCGDVPTMETLAAVALLREQIPGIAIRVINVVDLMAVQTPDVHPHGMHPEEFNHLFGMDKPVVFAHHSYPMLIHRLFYKRPCYDNLHVRGYKEEGTTTTPFDMTVLNMMDRFHLALLAVERIPRLADKVADFRVFVQRKLALHKRYIEEFGEDMPEIREWQWPF